MKPARRTDSNETMKPTQKKPTAKSTTTSKPKRAEKQPPARTTAAKRTAPATTQKTASTAVQKTASTRNAASQQKNAASQHDRAASDPPSSIALRPLCLALPKGRILEEASVLFRHAGVDLSPVFDKKSRKLVHDIPGPDGPLRVYVVRDADVPTYVEHGAADIGIAGRDVLEEQGKDLYEPLDLGIGKCRLSVAEPEGRPVDDRGTLHLRVATKFPNLTRRHLEAKGIVAEVIKLYGSIELGPLTGLADRIVDLVSTGETLKQNHLCEVEKIMDISARLVVNRASLKVRRAQVDALVGRLRAAVMASGS